MLFKPKEKGQEYQPGDLVRFFFDYRIFQGYVVKVLKHSVIVWSRAEEDVTRRHYVVGKRSIREVSSDGDMVPVCPEYKRVPRKVRRMGE